ncbi:MAG: hypothetical protein QM709_08370 [Spongiibacteraceae bacterium]
MNLDMPAQRLIINSLKLQIEKWQERCNAPEIDDDEVADLQNDIGYAFTILSELEESFFKQFGTYTD